MCLMFEMKDEGESDPRKLAQMMQNLGVFISVKPKAKQSAKVQQVAQTKPRNSLLLNANLINLD